MDRNKREALLKEFISYSKKYPCITPFSLELKGNLKGPRTLVTFCVHGNEWGPFPGILKFIQNFHLFQKTTQGSFVFCLGNVEAYKEGKRCLKRDLNRSFGKSFEKSYESDRAKEIEALIVSCDTLIDLHQCIEPAENPFYIFCENKRSLKWAELVGLAKHWINTTLEYEIDCGTTLAVAEKNNIPNFCCEISQIGVNETLIESLYEKFIEISQNQSLWFSLLSNSKNINMNGSKKNNSSNIRKFELIHSEVFHHIGDKLVNGITNFTYVKKNQVVGTRSDNTEIYAVESGYVLFPKYPQRNSKGEVQGPLSTFIYELAAEENVSREF